MNSFHRRLLCMLLALLAGPVHAAEYINHEAPVPGTAVEVRGPLEAAFDARPVKERFLAEGLKDRLSRAPDFFADATLEFQLRSYYFSRRNPLDQEADATVTGGRITLESGDWRGFGVGLAYYNSTELAQSGSDTGLLAPGGENINVLGEANLHYTFDGGLLDGSQIKLYRQQLNLPYLNKSDIRQLPAVHEAYTLGRAGDERLDYQVGYVRQFKDFDDENFRPMGEAAGAPGSDDGLTFAGARYDFAPNTTLGAVTVYGHDTYNTFFAEGSHAGAITEAVDFKLQGQFTDQRSVGGEDAGDFDTWHYALKATSSWKGGVVSLGYSETSDNADIRLPFGSSPSYNSIMREDFDAAGERSVVLGFAYNPERFTRHGLSSFAGIGRGTDRVDQVTGDSLPDRTEYDITVDYRPPRGLLEGLWLRARYNYIDTDGEGQRHDVRIILNYDVPML